MGWLTPIGAIELGSSFREYTNYLPSHTPMHLIDTGVGPRYAPVSNPALEITCNGVLGHYSLLDGITSDRACVGPVECGARRWGFITTSCLVEHTGENGWCGRPRGLTRKGCGLKEGMICLHTLCKTHYRGPHVRGRVQYSCHEPCGVAISTSGEYTAMGKPWGGRGGK
eukprot:3067060-Prymnesium_polylepis.1